MARLSRFLVLSSLLGPLSALKHSLEKDFQFLIMSSPHFGQVSYVQVPTRASDPSKYGTPQALIASGLTHPQGIAYDRQRKRLLIADPDVKQILSYTLDFDVGGSLLVSSGPFVVCKGVESRWVSVDDNGDVLFSDEPENMILKVAEADVLGEPDKAPEILYNGGDMVQISEPGGVAVDTGNIYWTNKHYGTLAGSVIRARKTPAPEGDVPGAVSVLASNTERSYGVCVARGRLYYTDASLKLYSLSLAASAGNAVELSRSLRNPRGCTADEDGHVFLADRGAGAVYVVEATNHNQSARLTRVFDHQDAFGVAIARKPFVSLSEQASQQLSNASSGLSSGVSSILGSIFGGSSNSGSMSDGKSNDGSMSDGKSNDGSMSDGKSNDGSISDGLSKTSSGQDESSAGQAESSSGLCSSILGRIDSRLCNLDLGSIFDGFGSMSDRKSKTSSGQDASTAEQTEYSSGLSSILGRISDALSNIGSISDGKSKTSSGQAESSAGQAEYSGCPWMGIGPCNSAVRMRMMSFNLFALSLLFVLY